MPDDNDGCPKCVIDTGMGIFAADLYTRTVARVTGLAPVDYEAAGFYRDVVQLIAALADEFSSKHLTPDQRILLMAQIDKECYRADNLIAWCRVAGTASSASVSVWTTKLFEWAKDDQTFYTAFAAEVD